MGGEGLKVGKKGRARVKGWEKGRARVTEKGEGKGYKSGKRGLSVH